MSERDEWVEAGARALYESPPYAKRFGLPSWENARDRDRDVHRDFARMVLAAVEPLIYERAADALKEQADKLSAWMQRLPIGAPGRMDLSRRAYEWHEAERIVRSLATPEPAGERPRCNHGSINPAMCSNCAFEAGRMNCDGTGKLRSMVVGGALTTQLCPGCPSCRRREG